MNLKTGSLWVLLGVALVSNSCARNTPTKDIERLVVNPSTSYRTRIRQSEEEGVMGIREIVKSSPLEEAWGYLPERNLWIELGKNEKPEEEREYGFSTSTELDGSQLTRLIKNNNQLIIYHFHPKGSQLLEHDIKKREKEGKPMDEEEISILRTDILVSDASPSESDIFSMIESSKFFYKYHPKGRISHKVCSLYGIAEYSLTKAGREYYKDKGYLEIIVSRLLLRSFTHVDYYKPDDTSKIKDYCEGLNIDYRINVTFTPYEEFLAPTPKDN